MGILEDALGYLDLGLIPIPLRERGKRPLAPWQEFQQRRPLRSEVTTWFTDFPTANVGLVTGRLSGHVVIDCDSAEGEQRLQELIGLPITPVNVTAKGRHWVFAHPGGQVTTRTGLLPGADVRGDGGYIVAPPSVHQTGWHYRWDSENGRGIDVTPVDLPGPLIELLSERHSASQTSLRDAPRDTGGEQVRREAVGGGAALILEGTRNDSLTRMAGVMLAAGSSAQEVLEESLRCNRNHCVPPLPDDEVHAIVESIATRQASKSAAMASGKRVHPLELNVRRLDSVLPEELQWLWPGYIPFGSITLFDGEPGIGKSTFALDMAACVSTGRSMPDGSPGMRGHVLLLSVEDSIARTVVPRLTAAGGDASRITAIDTVQMSDGTSRLAHFPEDLGLLHRVVNENKTRLIIVDPFSAFLSARVNSWSDQSVRVALAPLAKLADEAQLAVIMIRHPTKNREAGPMEVGAGSKAIIAAARSAFYMGRDPEDEGRVIMAPVKQNLSVAVPSLAFRIVSGFNGSPKTEWLGASSLSAEALLPLPRQVIDKLAAAVEMLEELLAVGPRPQKLIEDEATRRGVSGATLKRAKRTLGVASRKEGFGENGNWTWELPNASSTRPIPDVSALETGGPDLPCGGELGVKKLNLLNRHGSVEDGGDERDDDPFVERDYDPDDVGDTDPDDMGDTDPYEEGNAPDDAAADDDDHLVHDSDDPFLIG
jgi:archaellum biogenesis ATPase FlaH